MTINIIGGGIGGLTVGIALKQKGFKVRVFEQAKEIKPVGAGIILAINAMQVYQKLNLSDKIIKDGNPISSINLTNQHLKSISKTNLKIFENKYQLQTIAIHRGVLQQILAEEFTADELFLNHELATIKKTDKKSILCFRNHKEYISDLVIGADGIHSKTRDFLSINRTLRSSNQLCWRGVLEYKLPEEYKHQAIELWEKGTRFGFVKIDKNCVYWFALKSIHKSECIEKKIAMDDFENYDPLIKNLILNTPKNKIHTSEIVDIKPYKNWSNSTICLLGDAAHAMTPNMGQGACQAIEDAYVLANCLYKYNSSRAFVEFEKLRVEKVHQIIKGSYVIGKIAHWSNPFFIFLRNGLLRMIPQSAHQKQLRKLFTLSKF